MAELPFNTRARNLTKGGSSGAGVSYRPPAAPIAPKPSTLPDSVQLRGDRGKKRTADDDDVIDHDQRKKRTILEDTTAPNPVIVAFGGLASRHYTELDLNTKKRRNDEEEETALKAAMGDVFYHGLRVLGKKNSSIREQEKANKRLALEVGNLNVKLKESEKAVEEAKLLREELEKMKADRVKEKADHDRIVCVIHDKLASSHKNLTELKASFDAATREQYNVGYLDYLRTFLAADLEYNWAKFAPSTTSYMEKFKVEQAVTIREAKEALDLQFKEEDEEDVSKDAKGAVDASPSHQTAV